MLSQFRPKSLLVSALCVASFGAVAQEPSVPKYLQLARDFVANTKQENNSYSNTRIYTRMPGDLFASEYVVATDCGGFVEDMFRRTNSGVLEQLKTKKFKTRFSIFDWHPSIEKEEAFTRISKVTDIKPGDVAAWLYTEKVTHTLPGHILFIDSPPVRLNKPRKPLVDGLDQYEVTIIDTSQEAKSRDDTRFVSDAALRDENEAKGKQRGSVASPNYKGVGRGHIRFYADSAGAIKGIAFSFDKAKFHGLDDWSIVVGRPKLKAASAE
jgi:hypothetical protein